MRRGRVLELISFVKRRLGADFISKTFHTTHPRRYVVALPKYQKVSIRP